MELFVDMLGTVASGGMSEAGLLTETIEATSGDGVLTLLLFQGTKVLDSSGNPLNQIKVESVTSPEPSPNARVIGRAYDFEPCSTFDPPIDVVVRCDMEALGETVETPGWGGPTYHWA